MEVGFAFGVLFGFALIAIFVIGMVIGFKLGQDS